MRLCESRGLLLELHNMPKLHPILAFSNCRRGWTLIALGLLVGVIWSVSLFAGAYMDFQYHGLSVFHGVVQYHWYHKPYDGEAGFYERFLSFYTYECDVIVWPEYFNRGYSYVNIPLWPFALALILPGAYLLYRARPVKPGQCSSCRYDRSGLSPVSPCPECGQTPRPSAS